jgi:hypothetical protein
LNNKNTPDFIYYAHHKCASSWVNRFLWKVTAALGVKFDSYHSDEQAGGSIPEASFDSVIKV